MRRAVVALILTAVVVAGLVSYRTHPPRHRPPRPAALTKPAPRTHPPGTRAANGVAISTPYTTIQVRAFVRHGRLIDVQEITVDNDNAHTRALNARAIPILHEEALKAGSARIHTVSGATGTSASYISSLQWAIDRARG
jgi:uncharacterized protein with FMN-binding domain